MQARPRLRVEPRFVDECELPDEGQDGVIGQRGVVEQPVIQGRVQRGKMGAGLGPIGVRILFRVAAGVFYPVQRVLEWPVILGDPILARWRHFQPAFGVGLPKRPEHDI